jgi:hypothetical protein
VSDLADTFREWFLLNRDIIKQNVGKVIKVLVSTVALLVKNAKVLLIILSSLVALKIITLLGGMTLAIGPLIAGIVGLNANLTMTNILMGALPLLVGLAIAAIVALVLIVQDLKVFTEGGDSLFGRMAADSDKARVKIEATVKALKVLKILFGAFTDSIRIRMDMVKTIFNGIKVSLVAFNDFLWGVIDVVGKIGDSINKLMSKVIDPVILKVIALVKNIKSIATSFVDEIGNAIDLVSSKIDKLMNKLKPFKGSLDIRPTIPNVPGPRIGEEFGPQSSTINNVSAEIIINSASGNPESIGQAVANAINDIARNGTENNPVVVNV